MADYIVHYAVSWTGSDCGHTCGFVIKSHKLLQVCQQLVYTKTTFFILQAGHMYNLDLQGNFLIVASL